MKIVSPHSIIICRTVLFKNLSSSTTSRKNRHSCLEVLNVDRVLVDLVENLILYVDVGMLNTLSEVDTDTSLVGGSCDTVVKAVNIRVDSCKIILDVYNISRVLGYVRFEVVDSNILLIVLSLYEIKSVLSSVDVILSSCHPAVEGNDVVLCCIHSVFEIRDLGVVTIEPVLYGNHLTLK